MPSIRKLLRGSKGGQEDEENLHLVCQAMNQDTRVSRIPVQSTISRLMLDSFVPSFLSYLACATLDTSPSYSILFFPLLQLGVEKISKPLKSLFTKKSAPSPLVIDSTTPETMEQLTMLVKQLVMDQHRTMFYTVTLSTTPTLSTSIPKRRTEKLKVSVSCHVSGVRCPTCVWCQVAYVSCQLSGVRCQVLVVRCQVFISLSDVVVAVAVCQLCVQVPGSDKEEQHELPHLLQHHLHDGGGGRDK